MKPRPRVARTNRYHRFSAEPQHDGKLVCRWCPDEIQKLVVALKRLNSRTAGGKTNIDYGFLRNYLRTRSLSEIESVVERLKNKVLLNAKLTLKKQMTEERRARKPIEEWTNMASSLVGTFEETISTAFSQMLIVSSTEPCTLTNGDPPQVHGPPADGRTIPLRPMPVPVQGDHSYTKAVQSLETPAPTTRPAKVPPAPSQVVPNSTICLPQQQHSPTSETSPAATFSKPCAYVQTVSLNGQLQPTASSSAVVTAPSLNKTTQQPTEPHPATISITPTSESSSSSLNVPLSYAAPTLDSDPGSVLATVASTSSAISSYSTPPTLPQSISATALHAKFGRTSKYATKDSPRTFGVKCVVDFERIYRFLSVIQKPSQDCELTAMESAIVLDLLMSLPEELPLLDCNKLHKHMMKMYQCLSAPADSNMFKEMDDELFTQRKAAFTQDLSRTSVHQNTAGPTDSTNVTHGEGTNSAIHKARESQSINVTPPQLNPFIVPLTLLKRR